MGFQYGEAVSSYVHVFLLAKLPGAGWAGGLGLIGCSGDDLINAKEEATDCCVLGVVIRCCTF